MNTTTNTRGVSEALRDAVAKAIADVIGHGMREKCYAHADAAIAALSAPEPAAQGEAVAWLDMGKGEAQLLFDKRGDSNRASKKRAMQLFANIPPGYHPLYLHPAPPAQPAERVPDAETVLTEYVRILVDEHGERESREDRIEAMRLAISKAMLTASPAPSEGGKGVEFCSVCRKPFGPTETRVGTGDGTMRANNGRGSFAHRHCYEAAAQQAAR